MGVQIYNLYRCKSDGEKDGYKVWGYSCNSQGYYTVHGSEPDMSHAVLSISQSGSYNDNKLDGKIKQKIRKGYVYLGQFKVKTKFDDVDVSNNERNNTSVEDNFKPKKNKFLSLEKEIQWSIKPSLGILSNPDNFIKGIDDIFKDVIKVFGSDFSLSRENNRVSLRRDGKVGLTEIMSISLDSSKVSENFARSSSVAHGFEVSNSQILDKKLLLASFYLFEKLERFDSEGSYQVQLEYDSDSNAFYNSFDEFINNEFNDKLDFFDDEELIELAVLTGKLEKGLLLDNMENGHEGELFF
jgi:hypothetical protein